MVCGELDPVLTLTPVKFFTLFTCVALAKAGLVVGPLRPFVCPFVRLSVCLSATLWGA